MRIADQDKRSGIRDAHCTPSYGCRRVALAPIAAGSTARPGDPGPTERIAVGTLVGDAGQRVEGFLTRFGLPRSCVLVNAYVFALLPSKGGRSPPAAHRPPSTRPGATSSATTSPTPRCRRSWPSGARRAGLCTCGTPSPTSRRSRFRTRRATRRPPLQEWRAAIPKLREIVDPAVRPAGLVR